MGSCLTQSLDRSINSCVSLLFLSTVFLYCKILLPVAFFLPRNVADIDCSIGSSNTKFYYLISSYSNKLHAKLQIYLSNHMSIDNEYSKAWISICLWILLMLWRCVMCLGVPNIYINILNFLEYVHLQMSVYYWLYIIPC
jgi:hypothetical protein